MIESTGKPYPLVLRRLNTSLIVLTLLVIFVLTGLSFEGNWQKVFRVVIAFATYSCLLLLLFKLIIKRRLQLWPFLIAAAAAEAASGWLRPDVVGWIEPPIVCAASALGLIHWMVVRTNW